MQIHPQFRLNKQAYNQNRLRDQAHSWVKDGKEYERSMGQFFLDWLSPSRAIQIKTSGSTGTPKTIFIQKENMVHSAKATGNYLSLEPHQTALLCLTSEFIAGKMMLVRAMVLGLHITVVAASSNPLENDANSYDFAAMVPLQAQSTLSKLHQIKKLLIGGAPISKLLRQQLYKQPYSIYETYGMTETITHIALKKVLLGHDYFEALPNVAIETDDRGCLVIQAPKISHTPIITNDLVAIKNKKQFKWLGRYDHVINSGGIKLIPEQIEEKLAQIITNRFFITALPDQKLGDKAVLVVEGEFNVDELQRQIAQLTNLATYERPKRIIAIPQFIETKTAKVNRNKTVALIQVG